VIPSGPDDALGKANSVIWPAVVIRPTVAGLFGEPQRTVGPAVIPSGQTAGGRDQVLGDLPVDVIFPIRFPVRSVNHVPVGTERDPEGADPAFGSRYWLKVPFEEDPIALALR
jgi:hypothetical protein